MNDKYDHLNLSNHDNDSYDDYYYDIAIINPDYGGRDILSESININEFQIE